VPACLKFFRNGKTRNFCLDYCAKFSCNLILFIFREGCTNFLENYISVDAFALYRMGKTDDSRFGGKFVVILQTQGRILSSLLKLSLFSYFIYKGILYFCRSQSVTSDIDDVVNSSSNLVKALRVSLVKKVKRGFLLKLNLSK